MTAADQKTRLPEPDDKVRLEGAMLVIVPLIIGAAVVVSLVIFWGADRRRAARIAAALREEEIRMDLLQVYHLLRRGEADKSLALLAQSGEKLDHLDSTWSNAYLELKISRLLMEAEALMVQNIHANAPEAEKRLNQALAMMTSASGESWMFCMYARGRAKFETGDYAGAKADFDTLLDRNPSFASAYYWRSLARRHLGDDVGAVSDELRAKSLDSWPPIRDIMAGGLAEWGSGRKGP